MRQTNKFYWAKRFQGSTPEVVYINSEDGMVYRAYNNSQSYNNCPFFQDSFHWISNEPLEEPKITFENLCYYVIEVNHVYRTVAKYCSETDIFEIMGSIQKYKADSKADSITVVSGPYSLAELTNNKRIN